PQLPRLRALAPPAAVGPGECPPGGDGLSPGEPLAAAGPEAALGREARGDHRRRRGVEVAGAPVPGAVGPRTEGAGGEGMNPPRRDFLHGTAAASALGCLASLSPGQGNEARPGMGIVLYSFAFRRSEDRAARLDDPSAFLEHCRALGAGGVQMPLGARPEKDAARLRTQAEKARMYLEGIVRLPRDRAGRARFAAEARTARQGGATVLRTTLTDGRRYEAFDRADAFRRAVEQGREALARARPVLEQQNVSLAVENHKDLRSGELA